MKPVEFLNVCVRAWAYVLTDPELPLPGKALWIVLSPFTFGITVFAVWTLRGVEKVAEESGLVPPRDVPLVGENERHHNE